MSRLIAILEEKFVPIAAKVGNQKHLVAIRDAFAGLLPLVMVGTQLHAFQSSDTTQYREKENLSQTDCAKNRAGKGVIV